MIAGDLLGERARLTPDKLALVEVRSGRRFTYAELERRACGMARFWSGELGLAKGDRVGILAANCVEYVDAFFAAGKSGLVLVPLSNRLTHAEVAAQAADAEVRFVMEERSLTGHEAGEFRAVECGPEDPWCVLYTSGTTGAPKGVVLPHRMVLWNAYNTVMSWQLREDDVAPIFTPMHHAGGLAVFLTPLVAIGGTVVLHERFDAAAIWRAIEEERATLLFGVPTTFRMMQESAEFASADLSSLRWCISGGAPLPRYLIDAYRERGLVFKQGYGMTEAGVNCFAMTEEDAERKAGSIGKPMLFAQTRLCDAAGQDVAIGETGELWMKGLHVSPSAVDGDGWLHTGDLAHRDADGFYYIDGRIKDMFISGGVNVYPAEIESLLVQHPTVREAAVVGVADRQWGETGAAFVVSRGEISENELVGWLEGRLAKYKIPKRWYFLDALPRTAYGKVIKGELVGMVR